METDMTAQDMWDALADMGVSEETLDTVTDINGFSEETMCDLLYSRFGYRSFDQLEA